MSVLKNYRNKSPIEYERQYYRFTRYLQDRITRLPSRYRFELIDPFNNVISDCDKNISEISFLKLQGKGTCAERYKLILKVLENLNQITKLTYVYWSMSEINSNSITEVKYSSKEYWSNFQKKVTDLIIDEAKQCRKYKEEDIDIMIPYPYAKYKRAKFLEAIANIHKTAIFRFKHTIAGFKNRNFKTMLDLSADALYYANRGNSIKIIDESTKKKRIVWFDKAIRCLYDLDRPIRELAFDHIFTEDEYISLHEDLETAKKITQKIKRDDSMLIFEN